MWGRKSETQFYLNWRFNESSQYMLHCKEKNYNKQLMTAWKKTPLMWWNMSTCSRISQKGFQHLIKNWQQREASTITDMLFLLKCMLGVIWILCFVDIHTYFWGWLALSHTKIYWSTLQRLSISKIKASKLWHGCVGVILWNGNHLPFPSQK